MIVDDELLMRIGLKSMIDWEAHGFQIAGEAANGKEALELAAGQPPDLVIADIKMPVMDGLELIRQLSKSHRACQFVILSCLDEFQFAQEALRLGAVDYLIKSDIKQQDLLNVLEAVRAKIEQASRREDGSVFRERMKESIGYLKESLFKELLSGFLDEEEIVRRGETLGIGLAQGPMALAKLKVDRFDDIRRKYVEPDEKLLRYAVVNIMEEVIPRKWRKEIVTLNSAEYLLIANLPEPDGEPFRETLDRLFGKIAAAMKDFLNITFSIGVSRTVPGFAGLKAACREADAALRNLFFEAETRIFHYEEEAGRIERALDRYPWTREEEREFRHAAEYGGDEAVALLERLKHRLRHEGYTEQAARKAYFRVLSLAASCFPSIPEFGADGRTPYEQLLKEENLEGLHRLALLFLDECRRHSRSIEDLPKSYAEQASAILEALYAEDVSLQSVADRINVNPSYLSRVFKQETGENFVSYLTRIRIEKARQMLRNRNVKVYEVASRVGYPNTAYFTKIFKKTTGVTPEEYRG